MDTRFIGQPHSWDPRRVYSQTGADWQMRVDFERLRKERLAKLRASMKVNDLGALVLFAGANIRYATASYQGNWKYNINIRYCVVTHTGEPILFETAGSDLHCAEIDLPWMEGRIRPAITWQWAEGAVPYMAGRMAESVMEVLKEAGVQHRRRRDVENQIRMAEARRARAGNRSECASVHARARLRNYLRHHRSVGRKYQPVPPLGHGQTDPPGRP